MTPMSAYCTVSFSGGTQTMARRGKVGGVGCCALRMLFKALHLPYFSLPKPPKALLRLLACSTAVLCYIAKLH